MSKVTRVAAVYSLLAFGLAVGAVTAAHGAEGKEPKPLEPPTPAEVTRTLDAYYRETWGKDWGNAKVEKLTVTITEPRIGKPIEKQMGRGELARPVYPARAVVTIVVKYAGNDKPKETVIGGGNGDAFFFYKNAFDEWTFRTGSM